MASLNQIPPKRNLYTFISAITALLVALLALGALVLSYNALRGVATAYGLSGWQSYIWPLLLDFALVVFSLAVVRNALLREKTLWPWTLVGLYTAATIAFNILHAPATPVARVVAVVAPLSLFLSFETLMAQLKSEVRRHSAAQSLDKLTAQINDKRKTLTALTAKVETLTAQQNALQTALSDNQAHLSAAQERLKSLELVTNAENITATAPQTGFVPGDPEALEKANDRKRNKYQQRLETTLSLLKQGKGINDIAGSLNVTERTVRRYVRSLNGKVAEAAQ